MSDIMIPRNMGQVPAVFANRALPTDLAAGIVGGFGVVSIRGKAWRIKYRGEEQTLMRPDGDGAVSFIDAVIIRAAPHLSKIFYKRGYIEGAQDRPDCWSADSIMPDPSVVDKQSPTCGTCPQNTWGSRVTPAGKPSRACADSKRIAVVPLHDIPNEAYGGPMLLRIPPASLADVANYAQKMNALGYPYYAVGTRIQFDVESEYPRLIFSALRALTDAEAALIAELQDDPRIGRILAETGEFVPDHVAPAAEAKPVAAAPNQAPAPIKPEPPKPTPKPEPVAAPAAQAKPEVKKASGFIVHNGGASSEVDPGEVPAPLKRPQPKPKPKKDDPVAEDAPIAEFDAKLDDLLAT